MIHIMSPFHEECDISTMLQLADEFYVGIADEEWFRATRDHLSFNTRGNRNGTANFHSWEALASFVRQAVQMGKSVYLTVNTHNIDGKRIPIVRRIIRDFASIGGTGIISSELNGLRYAKEEGLVAVLSTNVPVYNCQALNYLSRNYEIDRLVLPRDVTLNEIRSFREHTELELEVFGMNFGCKFSNGHCLGSHNHAEGGFCNAIRSMDWAYHTDLLLDQQQELIYQTELNHWIYSRYYLNRACGLCALYELNELGINSFKIVGRELPGTAILACLKTAVKWRQEAVESSSEKDFLKKIHSYIDAQPELGCKWGYQCYYPEKYSSEAPLGLK